MPGIVRLAREAAVKKGNLMEGVEKRRSLGAWRVVGARSVGGVKLSIPGKSKLKLKGVIRFDAGIRKAKRKRGMEAVQKVALKAVLYGHHQARQRAREGGAYRI